MKLFFRILLFSLCIITGAASLSLANEIPSTQDSSKYEMLEKNYVKLEISEVKTGVDISILKPLSSLLKTLTTKYYSLLNWTQRIRHANLQIENYDRILNFGRWINDTNDDTCFNTRALVLIRDSANKDVEFKDNNHCSVATGKWNDAYTGKTFKSSEDIQIDHFVPLKNAYLSGAHKWSFKTRCLYANFLGSNYHLLSVNSTENMRKGDRAPDHYIPPSTEYTCTYIKNWLSIKFLWGLKMTVPEAAAITTFIKDNHCNARSLYISSHEIQRQSKFLKENIDLCEKLDAARKITTANP
ncbi:MAG: DUF1524 domain-containing protein [Bdellovibrionota bacterium]